MVYLDYSATTPVNSDVLTEFNQVALNYIGNPNSSHALGYQANLLQEKLTVELADMLEVKTSEIIYTSGASESNNLAIKGIAFKYQNRGKHIITTMLEHASIFGPLSYLQENGFEVEFVNLKDDGQVDLNHLQTIIRDDTILVSIAAVDSELGILQPIEEIAKIVKKHPKCFFHSDVTQAIGKIAINFNNLDLASFSAHKFYGLKGIGALIKKEKIMLEPIIHGGKSTTAFRSGTPALPLIASLVKAFSIINQHIGDNYQSVKLMHDDLIKFLQSFNHIIINSSPASIPFVINFSLQKIKAETFVRALDQHQIYISTKSACSKADSPSKAVYAVTRDQHAANNSLRISLSYLTTPSELQLFKEQFQAIYNHLNNLKSE